MDRTVPELAVGLVSLLVPPLCASCGAALPGGQPLCGECMRALNHGPVLRGDPPEGLAGATAAAPHAGVARRVLLAYKFRGMPGLADLIVGDMADASPAPVPGTVLVPVPSLRRRRLLRGFDPVKTLAAGLARRFDQVAFDPDLLVRRGRGRQRGRSRSRRLADPPDIRLADRSRNGTGRPALVVDDVLTTGATLSRAAECLTAAGFGPVHGLTFTRRL